MSDEIFDVALTPATAPEAELLEWLNGAHTERFSIIIDRTGDGGSHWNVKVLDFTAQTVRSDMGASFSEAWACIEDWPGVKPEPPPAFGLITGGRDSKRS